MKKSLLFICLFFALHTFSQNYQLLDTADFKKRTELIRVLENNFKSLKKQLKKKHKKKVRKEIEKSYKNIYNNFIKNIKKKKLVFNPEFTNYVEELVKKVVRNNPELEKENIAVFVSRYNSPNALSLGNGIIILNMGLFKYLDNEAQITAVLTHEMAHQILNHTENNIIYKATEKTSKENIKRTKKILKQKYNKYDKAFEILKTILYTDGKKHRKNEIEADSVGYTLYKKNNYPKKEFLNSLKTLALLDSLPTIQLQKSTYKKIFDLPNQPFKEGWLKQEDFSVYSYKKSKSIINKDSVKSHPEIVERIEKIKTTFSEISKKENIKLDNTSFKKLKNIAKKEDLANLFYLEKYGLSTYIALFRLEKDTKDRVYYEQWLGRNFKELYKAKEKYQFNRHVDRVVPKEQDESYQQFLNFLWNLRLPEIKNIANFYSSRNNK